MFEPVQMAKLLLREIAAIDLVMVAGKGGVSVERALTENYVMVEWGTSFAVNHARHFPDMPPPRIYFGLGRIALSYLLECGGACYLAAPVVEKHLERGSPFLVEGAPVITRQAFAVYPTESESLQLIEEVLAFFD